MRGFRHLTRKQRYLIQELLELEKSAEFIAGELFVHRSTIYREVKRNSNTQGQYHARGAQAFAMGRKPHPIAYQRKISGALELMVNEKLNEGWSPQQIAGRLKQEGRGSISHECIYRYIFFNRRCGGQLFRCLRLHNRRRIRGGKQNRLWKKIEHRKFIENRPEMANLRLENGHWERDLVLGKRGTGGLLTVVDRKSRYTLISKVNTRFTQEVTHKTALLFEKRPELPCITMTNDNGCEFGEFQNLEKRLGVPVYFTHPYCSWERGTNENTNGLLRQFFPKGIDFTEVKPWHIQKAEILINQRPRKTFNYQTPAEVLFSKETKQFKSKRFYEKEIQKRLYEEFSELKVAFG